MFSRAFLLAIIGQAAAELLIKSMKVGDQTIQFSPAIKSGSSGEITVGGSTIKVTLVGKNVLLTSVNDANLQYGKGSCKRLKNETAPANEVKVLPGHSCAFGYSRKFTLNGLKSDLIFSSKHPFSDLSLDRTVSEAALKKAAAMLDEYQAAVNQLRAEAAAKAQAKAEADAQFDRERLREKERLDKIKREQAARDEDYTVTFVLVILLLLVLGGGGYFYYTKSSKIEDEDAPRSTVGSNIVASSNRSKRVSDERV